jgi:hypothetical protein
MMLCANRLHDTQCRAEIWGFCYQWHGIQMRLSCLDGLSCDVVLSSELLFAIKAFEKFQDCFRTVGEEKKLADLGLVQYKKQKKVADLKDWHMLIHCRVAHEPVGGATALQQSPNEALQ